MQRLKIESDTLGAASKQSPAQHQDGHLRRVSTGLRVGLLTGADDLPYALGLTLALAERGVHVEFIGSDRVCSAELLANPMVTFLNLRGDQSENAASMHKAIRVLRYYLRLIKYAIVAKPRVFHILWNNKFELFDRTALMLLYRLMGRRVMLTAHNVNVAVRDGRDTGLNRLSLRVQYMLASHIFVHTERMRGDLASDFGVPNRKTTVIPFGVYNNTPTTSMTDQEAKRRLAIPPGSRVLLAFGQIAPYKGLEILVAALPGLVQQDPSMHLVIAGKVKRGSEPYWRDIERQLADPALLGHVTTHIEHIPDENIEIYFKAADLLVMPYTHIFQSGVLFLGYSFGLPVVATDVGSLKDDIVEGKTGMVCEPHNPADLARAIRQYFDGAMYARLRSLRPEIQAHVNDGHAWSKVAGITESAYRSEPLDR